MRRCLVLADGFFEWKKGEGKTKIPFLIRMKEGAPFAMAGLWDRWKDPSGKEIFSFTIVTTTANSWMKRIHDRMPVILPADLYSVWLSDEPQPGELEPLLVPANSDEMQVFPVSKTVNSPRNDLPECIERIELAEADD